jgi:3-oxoadipate enol-lactonase
MSAVAVSYTVDGAADAPVVVLSNSLGATRGMWDPQVPALAERFRVVTYDTRGHGDSPAPAGPYTLDDLVDDLVALLDEVGAERAHIAGLSLGGMTAMRLAAREPARVDRLALLCTSAKPDPRPFLDRAVAVRSGGTAPLAPIVASRWLTPAHAAEHPELVARLEGMIAGSDDEGYAACCEVVAQVDLRADCARIAAPTLVVSGWEDPALPPEHQKLIADSIPGAELVTVSPGAHLANLEQPLQVTGALLGHFDAAGLGRSSASTGGTR